MKKSPKLTIVAASACALSLALAGCGGTSGQDDKSRVSSVDAIISAYGCEPAKPLIPSDTGEACGGNPLDMMFSKLVRFDKSGKAHNEIAKEIKANADMTQYKVTINDGWKFSDGTPVTASSFTKAWSWGANVNNAQLDASFFDNIQGYDEAQAKGTPANAQLSGLKVLDDHTFTVDLKSPSSTFPIQVGYTAFAPLPEVFYKDTKAFGEKPVTVGPYNFQSWEHNKAIKLVKNKGYKGTAQVKNGGLEFRIYTDVDAGYADVQAGNLDVIDSIPTSAQKTFQSDSTVQAYNEPGSVTQGFTIPSFMDHFKEDQEGRLRRQAISMSIDRKQIIDKVLGGMGTQPTDFTAPSIPGYSKDLKGSEVLKYNPKEAKKLWAQADAISKWPADQTFKLAYNSDGGAKDTYDAIANSIKNTLGIKAEGTPVPTFSEFRNNVSARKYHDAVLRSSWQPDYPSPENYLKPLYASSAADGNGSNDGDYKNPKFDDMLTQAAQAKSVDEANKIYQRAEGLLMEDLPAVPIYYANAKGAAAKNVNGFTMNWKNLPVYEELTK
ncbi:oligopeptide-binding protein OppA [Bifidobacterium actinocoloniiforme DSM 22766]|uniref:Oligopeptide-binding protein OppA n=1 Tax=Bifidobacterium actinocoloniiforme DSM 22766 TaxID=1437605 RepID=A0A086Z0W3_9BIFI|nr:ABC transporter substrate-binding protein [Bifidobacterium actinocoloniiforme]AKV55353.1 ABC transporter substrate-binding protein [Bifidobacterium actinocoloniiforme DSM 22766]KFI40163.1 oligopeptide-binding protein OppA [Bifidobacterium actinocoloniiforme DSM 22766]